MKRNSLKKKPQRLEIFIIREDEHRTQKGTTMIDDKSKGRAEGKKTPPVHKIRVGLVTAAIWRNSSSDGKEYFYATTYSCSYKDKAEDGSTIFREGSNFSGETQNACLAVAAQMATAWIAAQRAEDRAVRKETESAQEDE